MRLTLKDLYMRRKRPQMWIKSGFCHDMQASMMQKKNFFSEELALKIAEKIGIDDEL